MFENFIAVLSALIILGFFVFGASLFVLWFSKQFRIQKAKADMEIAVIRQAAGFSAKGKRKKGK